MPASKLFKSNPQLDILFSAYFHQDWNISHSDELSVVRTWVFHHGPKAVKTLSKEVTELMKLQDSDLEKTFKQASLDYSIGDNAQEIRDWLAWLSSTATDDINNPERLIEFVAKKRESAIEENPDVEEAGSQWELPDDHWLLAATR